VKQKKLKAWRNDHVRIPDFLLRDRSQGCWRNLTINFSGEIILGNFKIAGGLEIKPETRAGIELTGQVQGGVRGDAAAFADNFDDAGDRNTQIEREPGSC
jgi:hypothetical protein